MKGNRRASKKPESKPDPASGPAAGVDAPQGIPKERRWLFRLMAAALLPVLLVLLELALWIVGYGHPTTFFVSRKISGKDVLVENTWFGLSFFPPAQARSPSPLVVQNPKPPGVCRIFLFGESAAMGDPRPAYGMGRCLEALLRARFPEREFEVVCVGMTAINSHGLLPIARECARCQGDLWIIYTGHNEFVGPFGANTVFGPAAPAAWMVRGYLALERTRTGQLLVAVGRRLMRRGSHQTNWGGMRVFLDQQVSPADPRKEKVYSNFRRNMEDIIQTAIRRGVPVILSSAASNLKDCAPFASLHAPDLQGPGQTEWSKQYQSGLTNQQQGDFLKAFDLYRAAAELSPLHAEGQFRLGQCALEITNVDAAARAYTRARDADGLPFRASTRVNQIIHDIAERHSGRGVTFLNASEVLESSAPNHILGDELFLEHVHFNFEGNYMIARALAEKAASVLPRDLLGMQTPSWEDTTACAQDLALTDWNRYTILEDIRQRIMDAPFTNQADHAIALQKLESRLAECKARSREQSVAAARQTYQQAIQKHPGDHWLHHTYAEFLAMIGDLAQASEQMRAACELAPQHYAGQIHLGRLLARQERFDEAARAFAAALAVRPGSGSIYVDLARVHTGQGRFEQALEACALAQRFGVDPAQVCLLRAQVFRKQQKLPEAIQSLRESVRLRPDDPETHDRLGMEYVLQNKFQEAAAEFATVVRLRPNSAEAYLNLGIALARQNKFDEALPHLETVRRLEPGNRKAREIIEAIQQRRK